MIIPIILRAEGQYLLSYFVGGLFFFSLLAESFIITSVLVYVIPEFFNKKNKNLYMDFFRGCYNTAIYCWNKIAKPFNFNTLQFFSFDLKNSLNHLSCCNRFTHGIVM